MAVEVGRGYVLDKVDGKFCIIEDTTRKVAFTLSQLGAVAKFSKDSAAQVTVTFFIEAD